MDEKVQITKKKFFEFLKTGYCRETIQDWLKLARSSNVSITEQKTQKNPDVVNILRFYTFFNAFNILVSLFFYQFDKYSELSLVEKSKGFIKLLTEADSEICLKSFNPFKDLKLYRILQTETDKKQIDSNFELLSKILSVYFDSFKDSKIAIDTLDIDLLAECNVVLNYFFEKLQDFVDNEVEK